MGCQAFHLACHPSKNPEILFLFSYQKFGLICILLVSAFLSYCYAKKLSSRKSSDFLSNKRGNSFVLGIEFPYFIVLLILSISYFINLYTGFSTGVDFATQLKTTLQWDEGLTDKWNHTINVDMNSLNQKAESWLFRPHGALLYYVPFIQLPIPSGEALRLAQLSLCLIICFSWIKIAKCLLLNHYLQLFLGIVLALWVSNDLSYAGNVQLLATAYSSMCTLFALLILLRLNPDEIFKPYNITVISVLSVILGCIVF